MFSFSLILELLERLTDLECFDDPCFDDLSFVKLLFLVFADADWIVIVSESTSVEGASWLVTSVICEGCAYWKF